MCLPVLTSACSVAVSTRKVFRNDLSLSAFQRQFSVWNSTVLQQKQRRFSQFLRAAGDAELFDRPDFVSPFCARRTAMPAMFDVLQASSEDVDVILTKLLSHYAGTALLGAAGDGLSFMRVLQAIAADQPRFHGATPFILPILGLSPHLEFHVVHAGWRNYRRYVHLLGAVLNNCRCNRRTSWSRSGTLSGSR